MTIMIASDREWACEEGLMQRTPMVRKVLCKALFWLFIFKDLKLQLKKEKLRISSIGCMSPGKYHKSSLIYKAGFWYEAIHFNMIKLQTFHDILTAMGSSGSNLQPPFYNDARS